MRTSRPRSPRSSGQARTANPDTRDSLERVPCLRGSLALSTTMSAAGAASGSSAHDTNQPEPVVTQTPRRQGHWKGSPRPRGSCRKATSPATSHNTAHTASPPILPPEVLSLKWPQVDFSACTVRLEPGTTKNKEGRTFPFAEFPELRTLLEEQRARTEALQRTTGQIIPWVFHRDGKPIKDFRSVWRTARKEAGAPGRVPHDFRRTAVRNLVRAGVPELVAMRLTGHKTRSVFDRYNIVSEGDLSEAGARLSRRLRAESGTVTGTVASVRAAAPGGQTS
jgi:hypothetical protein